MLDKMQCVFSAVFNFFCSFQTFFSDFMAEINEKRLKMNKNEFQARSDGLVQADGINVF